MSRAARNAAALALALAAAPPLAADPPQSACADRLDATLADMLTRPLLKEEHATALMWLRMDAEQALAQGNDAECLDLIATVETLLGITPDQSD
ncbi:MAG: hypothetical protein ACXIU7_08060 [Roseinatronobacter sp.]